MGLFSKGREKRMVDENAFAEKIAGILIHWQGRLALLLGRKTRHYSGARWLTLLALFCLCAGSYCIYLIFKSIL